MGALILLVAAAAALYGIGLGATDLWAPDEPRYAAIAEELRSFRHGPRGWVVLHLNDAPYTQKPPLYFWIAALLGVPGGQVSEVAARLPSVLAGVASVGLTAWIGFMLFRRWAPALFGAALLATSFRFAFTARRASLDVLLCGFEVAAVAAFLLLETRRGGIEKARRSPRLLFGLHAALGAAALVKGPVAWLPLLVFVGYLAWEGRLPALRALLPAWSWALSIGPIALWALSAFAFAPPGFAGEALGDNLIGRFFSGTSHARPLYYFLYQLPLDFLPWSLFLPFALAFVWRSARSPSPDERAPCTRSSARFLLCWALIPFVFFSLSAGKRGVYLLPIFPPLALMMAQAGSGEAGTPRHLLAWTRPRQVARAVILVALIEGVAFGVLLPRLDPEKSPRPIAQSAAAHARAGEVLGVYGMTPIEGALTYYGGPRVASLRDLDQLEAFLAKEKGRLVLLRARHLAELGDRLRLRELESFRSGRRRLSLARSTAITAPRESSSR